MAGAIHTREELILKQSLPLEVKVRMTEERIAQWYYYWGGQVYVSFSGGKDSTVLLHIARNIFPDIEAVYVDTGLEYPEIREFVKGFDNVTWLKPKKNFKQIIEEYGYPVISKKDAKVIRYERKYRETGIGLSYHLKYIGEFKHKDKINKSQFNLSEKWRSMADAPFKISDECCDFMKKEPAHRYTKESGKKPIIGILAEESVARTARWLKDGCNAFESKNPQSNPMSFWTEQDVLHYIFKHKIPIAKPYGKIVVDDEDYIEGQITIDDSILDDVPMKCTGCNRTGCMFCMFGAHLEKSPNRFEKMKETHPKIYDYCMRSTEDGGLGMDEVLNYLNIKH